MSQAPVRVLHVIRHMNMGGAQRQIFHLATGLERSRFHPVVVSLHREEPLMAELRDRGVETACIPARRRGLDPTLPGRIAALARRHDARILQTHLFAANAWGRLAGRLARVPVVIATEHTVRPQRRWRELLAERALAPWTSAYVVVSEAMGRTLARQLPSLSDRIVAIPNGVDLAAFSGDAEESRAALRDELGCGPETRLLGVLANLTPDKGHRFLLQAVASMGDAAQDLRLVLIGEGAEREAIAAQARDLGLADQVTLLGHRNDVPRLLPGLDLLAQPSVREGMPVGILEGMAAGLPIAATDVGGTTEALDGGNCGLLVPPRDPAALRRALEELLGDPDRAGSLAAAGRRRVEQRYSVASMVRRTEDLYDRLLANYASPGS